MAKAKIATATPAETAPVDPAAPIGIKVQGLHFTYAPKYFEGHILSAEEAAVLNQTFGENLRNNFATKIRAKLEEIAEAAEKEGIPARELTDEEKSIFATEFAAYASTYTFKAPRSPTGTMDPVEHEAHKIASALVRAKLAEKNIKKASLPDGKFEEYVKGALAKRPEIREEAKRRVEAQKNVSNDLLDELA